jgi:hypothetical protein
VPRTVVGACPVIVERSHYKKINHELEQQPGLQTPGPDRAARHGALSRSRTAHFDKPAKQGRPSVATPSNHLFLEKKVAGEFISVFRFFAFI